MHLCTHISLYHLDVSHVAKLVRDIRNNEEALETMRDIRNNEETLETIKVCSTNQTKNKKKTFQLVDLNMLKPFVFIYDAQQSYRRKSLKQ